MDVRLGFKGCFTGRIGPAIIVVWTAVMLVLVSGIGTAMAASRVGTTVVVVNTVTGTLDQTVRVLALSNTVYRNEIIETAANSASEIVFLDSTKLTLGPNSRLTLDRFVYDPDKEAGVFILTASEGVFRFFSGKLASASYTINTPTATIGIRGTVLTGAMAANGTTVIILGRASQATLTSVTGQVVSLEVPGLSTTISPDGSMTAPGSPPDWAVVLVREMDRLLAVRPPRSNETPSSPPEPPELAELGLRGLEQAKLSSDPAEPAVDASTDETRGLSQAFSTQGDVSAFGQASHPDSTGSGGGNGNGGGNGRGVGI